MSILSIDNSLPNSADIADGDIVETAQNADLLLIKRLQGGDLEVLDILYKNTYPIVFQELGLKTESAKLLEDVLVSFREQVRNQRFMYNQHTTLVEQLASYCRLRWEERNKELQIEEKIIKSLQNNDGWAFYYIQKAYYPSVSYYVRTCGGTVEDVKDIIMEAILALMENVQANKYRPNTHSKLKTYFLGICRNKWKDQLKKNARIMPIGSVLWEIENDVIEASVESDDLLNERQKAVVCLFDKATDTCKKVLGYYYYDNLSHNEIANKMGYTNADTSKNQKLKCLKKLKVAVLNFLKKDEL